MADRGRTSGARANARVEVIVARQRWSERHHCLEALARDMQATTSRLRASQPDLADLIDLWVAAIGRSIR